MVRLIIRDDDLNFFSKAEDIEEVYKEIDGFPISFAIIPMVLDVSTEGNCSDTCGNVKPRWFGDNLELVSWLKNKLRHNEADCLLHGITHEFKIIQGKGKMAEFEWRDCSGLTDMIIEQKNKLEQLFDYPISVFVAPRNVISKDALKCVSQAGLNYSGIVPLSFKRDYSMRNISSYFYRVLVRAIYTIPFPGILRYSDHLELNACGMHGFDYLVKMFNYCEKRNLPMAINVHYWHIRDNNSHYNEFFDFIKYAIDHGACPSTMSEVINDDKEEK